LLHFFWSSWPTKLARCKKTNLTREAPHLTNRRGEKEAWKHFQSGVCVWYLAVVVCWIDGGTCTSCGYRIPGIPLGTYCTCRRVWSSALVRVVKFNYQFSRHYISLTSHDGELQASLFLCFLCSQCVAYDVPKTTSVFIPSLLSKLQISYIYICITWRRAVAHSLNTSLPLSCSLWSLSKAYILSPQNSSSGGGCCDSGFLQAVSPRRLVRSTSVSWVQQLLEHTHHYSGAIPTSSYYCVIFLGWRSFHSSWVPLKAWTLLLFVLQTSTIFLHLVWCSIFCSRICSVFLGR